MCVDEAALASVVVAAVAFDTTCVVDRREASEDRLDWKPNHGARSDLILVVHGVPSQNSPWSRNWEDDLLENVVDARQRLNFRRSHRSLRWG